MQWQSNYGTSGCKKWRSRGWFRELQLPPLLTEISYFYMLNLPPFSPFLEFQPHPSVAVNSPLRKTLATPLDSASPLNFLYFCHKAMHWNARWIIRNEIAKISARRGLSRKRSRRNAQKRSFRFHYKKLVPFEKFDKFSVKFTNIYQKVFTLQLSDSLPPQIAIEFGLKSLNIFKRIQRPNCQA